MSRPEKNKKLPPVPQSIPYVKYMLAILGANDVTSKEKVASTLPAHAMTRHPKCSHKAVVTGPITKRNP